MNTVTYVVDISFYLDYDKNKVKICFRNDNFGHAFPEKTSKRGGGHFRSENFHCKFSAGATRLRKKSQYFFRKRVGVGKGSKAVRKFSGN